MYITHRRFRQKALCGDVNIPSMTACEVKDGVIFCSARPICAVTSENAHQYFAINTDGNGMERGNLTQAIQKRLAKRDAQHQVRWDKVWEDPICQQYKRTDHVDFWLWNHDFFNAPIDDLLYIADLVGAKVIGK